MNLLIGQYSARLTEKGRLALPSKYREILGTHIIIAKWYEGCLVVVDSNKWVILLKRLTGSETHITKSVRDTDRFILGSAFECDLDGQGRFVVPKSLRDYAGIIEEAVFLGLGDRIEIWDTKSWAIKEKQIQTKADELIEKIAGNAKQ